jgi:hypothetical protein
LYGISNVTQILLLHEETLAVSTTQLHFQFRVPLEATLNILSPIPEPCVQVWDQKRLWCALKGAVIIGYVKIRNCLLLVYPPLQIFLFISHFTIVEYCYNILVEVSCIGFVWKYRWSRKCLHHKLAESITPNLNKQITLEYPRSGKVYHAYMN